MRNTFISDSYLHLLITGINIWVNKLLHEETALVYSDRSLSILSFIKDENGNHSAPWCQIGCLPLSTGVLFHPFPMVENQVLQPWKERWREDRVLESTEHSGSHKYHWYPVAWDVCYRKALGISTLLLSLWKNQLLCATLFKGAPAETHGVLVALWLSGMCYHPCWPTLCIVSNKCCVVWSWKWGFTCRSCLERGSFKGAISFL